MAMTRAGAPIEYVVADHENRATPRLLAAFCWYSRFAQTTSPRLSAAAIVPVPQG